MDICRRVPDVYLELTGAIARSETSSAEIAAIIAKDPATSAKLLQLVNSACFGALRTNIGKLVLAVCIPGDYAKVQQALNKTLRPPHEIELEILGFSHAEDGAYLLALWGLPYPIVEAVAFHHNPGPALEQGLELPTTVSIANALVDEIMRSRPFTMTNHLETLGLTHELSRWTALARKELPAIVPEVMVQ